MKRKLRVVISCGPTREPLDPVRFISNYSTGTLGLILARACAEKGHEVTLAHGPIEIPSNLEARKIPFETVLDLKKVLTSAVRRCDVLFMVAAVSDFKPLVAEQAKIKKGPRFLKLSLVENPDVLKSLRRFKRHRVFIGFSLESRHVYRSSLRKLKEKGLDLIVAQRVTDRIKPFGRVSIDALVIDRRGKRRAFRNVPKKKLAEYLISKARQLLPGDA